MSTTSSACVGVPEQSAVLLGLLMLRGPQTAGELRINSERWYRFADISSVDAFLDELQDRSEEKGGPLVVKLPRAPGAREQRWAHLLCGPVDLDTPTAAGDAAGTSPWMTPGGWKRAFAHLKTRSPRSVLHCKMSLNSLGCRNPDTTNRTTVHKLATHWRHPHGFGIYP
jgi:uncharacterized protein YceH (UPF0502 family)